MEDKKGKGKAKWFQGGPPLMKGTNIKGIGKQGLYRPGLRSVIDPTYKGSNSVLLSEILKNDKKK